MPASDPTPQPSTAAEPGPTWSVATEATAATAAGVAEPGSSTAATLEGVAQALSVNVHAGRTEATITLQPPSLGQLRVRLVSGADGLTIRITAQNEAAGALLRTHAVELRDLLAHRGVVVQELHVLPNPPGLGGVASVRDAPARQRFPRSDAGEPGGGRDGQMDDREAAEQDET